MKQELTSFPTPQTGKLSLLVASKSVTNSLMALTAHLALCGQVRIIDGGNRFEGYALARALRRQTADIHTALNRVWLSRAFTCYQMAAMLGKLPKDKTPLIVLDMLSTFLDENIGLPKRQRLLANCLTLLENISRSAPVAIWARQRSAAGKEDPVLLAALMNTAEDIWVLEKPPIPAQQLPLF